MKTNLENYEERFVDYMEGQLNADEMREVEAFVAQHPELEEDFKLFCSTKLEPDTNVVYTKKEHLMQSKTIVIPLFWKVAAAAACFALLIALGIRFLKPHQGLDRQPMLASLTPITIQKLDNQEDVQQLRNSIIKTGTISKPISRPQEKAIRETKASIDLIAKVAPIKSTSLSWNGTAAEDNMANQMDQELGERLAAIEPYGDITPSNSPVGPKEQALASLQNVLLDPIQQNTKDLYKRTAKTIMDFYYTADSRINEAKGMLVASRQ